jgi:transcription antitermination factor NusG
VRQTYWTVLETHYDAESVAVKNAEAQGFECYLPRYRELPRAGVRAVRALFPGYVFVFINARWHSLANTRGVKRLFLMGEKPSQIPATLIDDIREREDELGYVLLDGEVSPRSLAPRQAVRSVRGIWAEKTGVFLGQSGRGRVRVLFQLMGRAVEAELSARDVVPA